MSKFNFQKKISTPAAAPAAPVVPVAAPVVPVAVPVVPAAPAADDLPVASPQLTHAALAPAALAPAAPRAPRRAWAPVGILGSEDEHGRPLAALPARDRGPRV